jgi:thioesterase domain-containing protein
LFDVGHLSRFVRLDTVCYDLARMEGEKRERWMQLAEQAAREKDPEILLRLIAEINELLEEKEQRLIRARLADKSGNSPAGSEAT